MSKYHKGKSKFYENKIRVKLVEGMYFIYENSQEDITTFEVNLRKLLSSVGTCHIKLDNEVKFYLKHKLELKDLKLINKRFYKMIYDKV